MKTGTSWFITYHAAIRYYRDYGYTDVVSAVNRKLAEGEIHIGEPPIKSGQYRVLIDDRTRYAIVGKDD